MKTSREWLQRYFDTELPNAAALGDALTFHAFEIESIENDILDVKVTANRGHDCLCHRGIAKELSAILKMRMVSDPLRHEIALSPKTDSFKVVVENAELCPRFTGALIRGVKVGPSPEWLRKSLEAIGQRSINNVVDATNFVMFDLGQPLHAFDAGKLVQKDNAYSLTVGAAKEGEKMLGLDDKEYALTPSMLVIADGAGAPVSIAGIKGGKPTGIDDSTKDIFLEAANWNGVMIRKTSQSLKLRTDASSRFEQVISPELAAYGIRAAADLILQIAGGEVVGFVDEYPDPPQQQAVSITTERINAILGSKLADADVAETLERLDLPFTKMGESFAVEPPFERLDLTIPEDLVEEVGRIVGYDKIVPVELPALPEVPEINANFYTAEHAREDLIGQGYSEVFTSVFADEGERVIANKVDGVRPYLRATLVDGLKDAHERNVRNKDLLGLKEVRLFQIGTIWKEGREFTMLGMADEKGLREEPLPEASMANAYDNLPLSGTIRYQSFSKYPFIVRDIALWVPAGTNTDDVLKIIREHAGELLLRSEKFDEFKKEEKISYAFRLVFQSFDKTLTDFDANERMGSVAKALQEQGFEIR